MKKVLVNLFAVSVICISACKGNSTGETGGAQADSGQNNVGNSGATDSSATSASSGTPMQTGTSGTDTSGNGKGTTNPTTDTLKTNP
jgi:hypothetical protein